MNWYKEREVTKTPTAIARAEVTANAEVGANAEVAANADAIANKKRKATANKKRKAAANKKNNKKQKAKKQRAAVDAAKEDMTKKETNNIDEPSLQAAIQSVKLEQAEIQSVKLKRDFLNCLKSPRQHDLEQDDNCATKPFQITIDVTDTDTLANQFKKAKTDHKNVFSALFQGVELLLVTNGNETQKIQLTTDDFKHNSDNDDYSDEDSVE